MIKDASYSTFRKVLFPMWSSKLLKLPQSLEKWSGKYRRLGRCENMWEVGAVDGIHMKELLQRYLREIWWWI